MWINSMQEHIVQADDAWEFYRHIPVRFSIPSFHDGNGQGTGKSAGNNRPLCCQTIWLLVSPRYAECPSVLLLHLSALKLQPRRWFFLTTRCWYPLVGKSNRQIQRGKPVVQRWLTFSWITSVSTMLPLASMSSWPVTGSIFPLNMSNECTRPFVSLISCVSLSFMSTVLYMRSAWVIPKPSSS